MRKLIVTLGSVLMTFAAAAFASAQDEPSTLFASDPIEFHTSGDAGECFVYPKFVIKTDPSNDGGSNISVFPRAATSEGQAACRTKGEPLLFVSDSDNNSFYGIADGRYMFINTGTSANSSEIEVYELNTRKSILNKSYNGEPKLIVS